MVNEEGKPEACRLALLLMEEVKKTNNMKYLDPHNCTGSCLEPTLGCLACSNPDYKICSRNNIEVCLHPNLVCDGHQHCDGGEDEDASDDDEEDDDEEGAEDDDLDSNSDENDQ